VRLVTWAGLVVNLLLVALKFVGGILGASQAVVADAVHSLSDCVTDIAVLVGVHYWSQPPDECHPYGHRRIETLVTIAIGLSLGVVGLGLGYNALSTLQAAEPGAPHLVAFVAALVSLVSKELLYHWTVYVGRRAKSSAAIANAWHHRSDALSSVPAVLAVGGAMLLPAWSMLDRIGAIVVSLFILHAAWRIVRPALAELVDAGASAKVRARIDALARGVPGVQDVHALRTRYLGGRLQVDLHVLVDPQLTVREGHRIAHAVGKCLRSEGPGVEDVLVHVEPVEET
jgi:cation diffusion facilitator family transporter